MNSYPLISVIIPNYNHARYLDQRIQSVLNQTYQNFEVIILDDCSPDNGASKTLIEKYRSDPKVSKVIYNEFNSGNTFLQWQKGMELSKGNYIWIAESDDYCEPTFLENICRCIEKYPNAGVLQSASKYVDEEGNAIYPDTTYSSKIEVYDGIEYIKKFFYYSNLHIPNASAVVFNKSIAQSIPTDYQKMVAAGDRLFWIFMLEKTSICQVIKPLNCFRQHNNKVSSRKEVSGIQCKENFKINQYLHSKGYIQGICLLYEYKLYYYYIQNYAFSSETIRKELLKLWFPWWKRNNLYYYIVVLVTKIYTLLYRK